MCFAGWMQMGSFHDAHLYLCCPVPFRAASMSSYMLGFYPFFPLPVLQLMCIQPQSFWF